MRKVICFHNPNEENAYLSNWFYSDFVKNGVRYSSMEQYMMHQKAITFGDMETAERIMAATDFGEIKALGRQVRNYDDRIWSGIRQIVVYEGLLEKFRQNPELKEQLLATDDAMLAECAFSDRIWAIGLTMQDVNRMNIEKWRGQNLLGFALMQVRKNCLTSKICNAMTSIKLEVAKRPSNRSERRKVNESPMESTEGRRYLRFGQLCPCGRL